MSYISKRLSRAIGNKKSGRWAGHLDGVDAGFAFGWAWNAANPDERVHVEFLADGAVVATAEAAELRPDLVDAGIGDGCHSFRTPLPPEVVNGHDREIFARIAGTEFVLIGSPRRHEKTRNPPTGIHVTTTESASLVLDNGRLHGWCLDVAAAGAPLPLEVLDGNEVVWSGVTGQPDRPGGRCEILVELPAELFDGRPHALQVRTREPVKLIAHFAEILPFTLTPEDALRRWGGQHLRSYLFPAAKLRYESLRQKVQQLAERSAADKRMQVADARQLAASLRQLARVHEQVIRGFGASHNPTREYEPLEFSPPPRPKVSVIVPVHNKFEVTYNCLASLDLAPNRASFEVIVVDDGSTDETVNLPSVVRGVRYLRHQKAQGFILSCNDGSRIAKGEYLVFLNNDTEVTAGWLDEMLYVFDHNERTGLVGSKLLYPNGTLQEAGGIVWGNGDPWNYGRNGNPHDPRYNYTREVDYLSGASIMLPRKLWKQLGGFDKEFIPAYFEDTDLAFRVRDAGYRVFYTPFSQVIHFEGISSGTSAQSGMKKYQEINRPKFKARWQKAYRYNGEVGHHVDLNKDRNVSLRGLVIDTTTPSPDQDAGSYAAVQEMKLLRALGCKLTFAPVNMAYLGEYTEDLQRMGVECLYAPFYLSTDDVIEKRGKEFDFFYITRYHVAEKHIDAIRRVNPAAKILLNNADLHFLRELRAAIHANSQDGIERAIQTREAELAVMRKTDLVLSYTDVEKAVILSHNLNSTRVAKCPWVVDVASDVPGYQERADIAFLGSYNHHPNAEAVEWFANTVMPLLRKKQPGTKFRVYGSNAPERLRALAEKYEDIILEGWVPTVDVVYNRCRVFVAPLQSGAGIKGKVIGAFAHGVPCVLSPIAAEGIPLSDGVDACIADKPEDWVFAISRLHQKPKTWSSMSNKALALARNQYGFAHGIAQIREALIQSGVLSSSADRGTTTVAEM